MISKEEQELAKIIVDLQSTISKLQGDFSCEFLTSKELQESAKILVESLERNLGLARSLEKIIDPFPKLMATFRPQAVVNKRIIDIDGEVVFDATPQILQLDHQQIREFAHNDYDSDFLANNLPERNSHSGPFEVDVDVDAWLESFGFLRETLTTVQWYSVKHKFIRSR